MIKNLGMSVIYGLIVFGVYYLFFKDINNQLIAAIAGAFGFYCGVSQKWR